MGHSELDRIRFVAQRFRALQGLRHLVVIPAVLTAFWMQPYLKLLRYAGPEGAILGLLGTLAPFLVVVAVRPLLDRYYSRRFGMVDTDLENEWPALLPDAVLLALGFLLDMTWLKAHSPSALLIAGTLVSLHVTIRDWPWRGYYLVPAVVCAIGAGLTVIGPTLRTGGVPDALRIPLTILLVPHLLTAVLDHRQLMRALPHNPDAALAHAADAATD
jgi:hypothetical protein